jgi:general stress protein YciG
MKSKRGFAAMDPKKQREIARKGGKAAQRKGTAHRFNHEEAVEAGRKGGLAAQESGNAYRFDSLSGKAASRKRRRR